MANIVTSNAEIFIVLNICAAVACVGLGVHKIVKGKKRRKEVQANDSTLSGDRDLD
jgi:hypothetical protein